MKTKMTMKKIVNILVLAIAMISCESYVTGIDEQDPTRVIDASLQQVYVAMETEFAGTMEGTAARLAGLWSGYFSGLDRQYIDLANYNVTAGNFDDPWANMYVSTMAQVRIAQGKAEELKNTNALGATQVIEAYVLGNAAALWGDVPYRDAWRGATNPNPAYDPQTQVIDDALALLDVAIDNLSKNSGNFPGEILGATTSAKWIKVANSLKARYLLYKKNYSGAAAAAALGVTATVDHLRMTHGTSNNIDRNIYYDFLVRQRVGYMGGNSFLQDMMKNRGDAKTDDLARRAVYFGKKGDEEGAGAPKTDAGGYFASDASFPLMTSWETLLIRSEAEAKASNSISAAALKALNDHRAILRATYPTGKYDDFVAADFADVNAFILEVWKEKYISLYGQMEVFNEIRRTGNPFGLTPVVGSTLPQRFLYSQNEVNSNTSAPSPIPDLTTKTSIFQ